MVLTRTRDLMAAQRETVQNQLDESAEAARRLATADSHHAERLAEARTEAQRIVEEAHADAVRIGDQLRAQAVVESDRIRGQGGEQVSLARAQVVRQLRGDLGGESVRRATELIRAHVSDPLARSATVDRFLDELESMAPAAFAAQIAAPELRSASRDAQAALVATFESMSPSMSGDDLSALSDDLAAVVELLTDEPTLARHLAGATGEVEAKRQLLSRLLGGKVGAGAAGILDEAVSLRWSTTDDLVDALEHVARVALLARAEREGQADEVAEQLFRFSRVLDTQPGLITLLGDSSRPRAGRVSLLRNVLESGAATPVTAALLAQTVRLVRGERVDEAVVDVAQLAVGHRGEVVAEVTASADLTDAQRTRLTEVLARIYHHPVSVQLNIDPEVLGGLAVAVGDEVIDATLSARLAEAATNLPD